MSGFHYSKHSHKFGVRTETIDVPTFVKVGGTCFRYKDGKYFVDAGEWDFRFSILKDCTRSGQYTYKLKVDDNWNFSGQQGVELTPITYEEYAKNNGGYIPSSIRSKYELKNMSDKPIMCDPHSLRPTIPSGPISSIGKQKTYDHLIGKWVTGVKWWAKNSACLVTGFNYSTGDIYHSHIVMGRDFSVSGGRDCAWEIGDDRSWDELTIVEPMDIICELSTDSQRKWEMTFGGSEREMKSKSFVDLEINSETKFRILPDKDLPPFVTMVPRGIGKTAINWDYSHKDMHNDKIDAITAHMMSFESLGRKVFDKLHGKTEKEVELCEYSDTEEDTTPIGDFIVRQPKAIL